MTSFMKIYQNVLYIKHKKATSHFIFNMSFSFSFDHLLTQIWKRREQIMYLLYSNLGEHLSLMKFMKKIVFVLFSLLFIYIFLVFHRLDFEKYVSWKSYFTFTFSMTYYTFLESFQVIFCEKTRTNLILCTIKWPK